MSLSHYFYALRRRVVRLADAFLFEDAARLSPEGRWRTRIAGLFVFAGTVTTFVFTLLYAWVEGGFGSNTRTILVAALLFLSALIGLRYTHRHRAVSTLALLTCYGLLFLTAFMDGPLSPPSIAWHALLPILGGLLVGVSGALLMLGLIAAEIAVFYVLMENGFVFPISVAPETEQVLTFWSVIGATAFSALVGAVYETTRRRMQRRLTDTMQRLHRAQKARYQALLEQTAEAICFVDPETKRIEEVNPSFLKLLGYREDEATALRLCDVSAETPDEVDERIRRARAGTITHAEHQWTARDGRCIDVQVTHSMIQQAGRSMLYVVARDVTQQKQAEQALRRSEKRYRLLMDSANDAIFIADARSGLIVETNQTMQALTGRSREELKDRPAADLVPPADQARFEAFTRLSRTGDAARRDDTFSVAPSAGDPIPVDVSVNVLRLDDATLVQGTVRDITDRKRYEQGLIEAKEQALEMSRLKSTLLENLSHEVRTPLTSISGFADILADEVTDEHAEFVEMIRTSSARLTETLSSVLNIAHPDSEAHSLTPTLLALPDLAREVVTELEPKAQKKGLALTFEAPPHVPTVLADEGAARRVLHSVVSNAVKFTSDGRVGVAVHYRTNETPEDEVSVRVTDTGIGIGEDFLSHVFDEFKQESSGLARSHEGCGLGLTIARRLMKRMGGSIEVESTKGQGSTFTLRFPTAAADAPSGERVASPKPRSSKA